MPASHINRTGTRPAAPTRLYDSATAVSPSHCPQPRVARVSGGGCSVSGSTSGDAQRATYACTGSMTHLRATP